MVIVKMTGGLGNQMFQYAAGRSASLRNKTELVLDTSFYDVDSGKQSHEKQVLIKLFPKVKAMQLHSIDQNFLADIQVENNGSIMRGYNYTSSLLGIKPIYKNVTETSFLTYEPDFHKQKATILYLNGDWQSENYFLDYELIIRNDFTFPAIIPASLNYSLLKAIQNTNSVSVHVRRGDYLSSTTHQPTSAAYYTKAIEMMKSKVSNPVFFVFSDDIAWCQHNLDMPNAQYVNHNFGSQSYIDMQLMSRCRHNVIANSSFSWWGAWLNNNPDKNVIAPKMWLEKLNIKANKIVPSKWIII